MVAAAMTIANMIDGLSIYPPISYKDYFKSECSLFYSYDMWLKKIEIKNLVMLRLDIINRLKNKVLNGERSRRLQWNILENMGS